MTEVVIGREFILLSDDKLQREVDWCAPIGRNGKRKPQVACERECTIRKGGQIKVFSVSENLDKVMFYYYVPPENHVENKDESGKFCNGSKGDNTGSYETSTKEFLLLKWQHARK